MTARQSTSSPSPALQAREAIAFTAGVDSFYSALKSPGASLVFIHGLDIPLTNLDLRERVSKKLVLRPSFGGGGIGIFFLEQSPAGYLVNSLPADPEILESLIRPLHDYLVTGFVTQAPYAAEIAPNSTNTLRILTLWDIESNGPFIAASCHRFGRPTSGPLDNFHAGADGLSVPIDPVSGELGQAVIRQDGEIIRLSHHPDTGKAIKGIVIPDWEQTRDELLALAAKLPYAPCVGWDLVKLEEGWSCLEGNPFPGYHVWQVHGPILSEPRAHRFYQEFGMLK